VEGIAFFALSEGRCLPIADYRPLTADAGFEDAVSAPQRGVLAGPEASPWSRTHFMARSSTG
jgi:hypothetical protein